jgi:hypothetical protein
MKIDTHFRIEIITDLFIEVSFYGKYDNQPTSGADAEKDFGTVLSFGWTF